MPANLTPEYKKAQDWYRSASTDQEKLAALEEMLRTIPKHKGSEGLQADIKHKISKMKATAETEPKKGGKHTDIFHIPRSGAGQIVLLGAPNCGKSSILAALTNAPVNVASYPFATDRPVPGMAAYQDIHIQLVDTPPITAEFAPPGLVNTLRGADIIAIVIDIAADALEQMDVCTKYLDSHRLLPSPNDQPHADRVHLTRPAFVIVSKSDLAPTDTIKTLKETINRPLEYIQISTKTGLGLELLLQRCFQMLNVVRVYAKKPGLQPDMTEPFTLPAGATVIDLAFHIHRQLAEHLKSARAWNAPGIHDGQNVPRDHILSDREIIELHFG